MRPALVLFVLLSALSAACARRIGDGCALNTDCSINNDRVCDVSAMGGYCTVPECDPNSCPDNGLCVEFLGDQPTRVRRFCMANCGSNSDCRSGYVCRNADVQAQRDSDGGITLASCPASGGMMVTPMGCARVLDSMRPRYGFCVQYP